MKNTTNETTVNLKGIDLIVEFKIHGRYIPETREQPAEYPEIEILTIKVTDSNVDIDVLLSFREIEYIETKIIENYEA